MIDREEGYRRMKTLQIVVFVIFGLLMGRVAYIQLIDTRYKELARSNVMRREVQYPPRGEVFDRRGAYLAQSRECYDLMVVYREMDKRGFDTARLCNITGITPRRLRQKLADARVSPRAPVLVANYIPKEDKLRFDAGGFRGFYAVYRTVRHYPLSVGGNLLGYVGEVSASYLKNNSAYRTGAILFRRSSSSPAAG